jgi:hypothetical protein
MPVAADPRALTTVAAVFEFLNYSSRTDTEAIDIAQRIINAASDTIHNVADREFVSIAAPGESRTFEIEREHITTRRIRIGDFQAQPTLVELRDPDTGQLWQNVTGYATPLPRVRREAWRPWTRLELSRFAWLLAPEQLMVVEATWGYPAVPSDILEAAIVTAATWFARDIEKFSSTFALGQDRVLLARMLPDQVKETVEGYRIISP